MAASKQQFEQASKSRKDVSTRLLTAPEWRLLLAMEVKASEREMSVNEDRFWSSERVKMRDGDKRGGPNRTVK